MEEKIFKIGELVELGFCPNGIYDDILSTGENPILGIVILADTFWSDCYGEHIDVEYPEYPEDMEKYGEVKLNHWYRVLVTSPQLQGDHYIWCISSELKSVNI